MAFERSLKELAAGPLADLEGKGGHTLRLRMPEGRDRDQVFEAIGAFRALMEQLMTQPGRRGRTAAGRALAENPVEGLLLLGTIPSVQDPEDEESREGGPVDLWRGDLMLQPFRLDGGEIRKKINRIGGLVLNVLEAHAGTSLSGETRSRARLAIENGVTQILRENLERLNRHKLFRAHPFTHVGQNKTREGEPAQIAFSHKDLKEAWSALTGEIPNEEYSEDEITMQLLDKLGFFKKEGGSENLQDYARGEIVRTLDKCLEEAWKFYTELDRRLTDAQREFSIAGEQIQLDPASNLQVMTVFELLNFFFKHQTSGGAGEEKDYYHVVNVLNLFFRFLTVANHPYSMSKSRGERELKQMILKSVFADPNRQEEVRVSIDENGDIAPDTHPQHSKKTYDLRRLKASKGLGKSRVWWKQTRIKEESAIVEKLLLRPDDEMSDLPDIIATSFVLWDLKEQDLRNEESLKKYLALAKKVGTDMGLQCREDVTCKSNRQQLRSEEFCVMDKTNGSAGSRSNHFPSIRLYGRLENGLPFEIQFLALDTHLMAESHESPNHHRRYETRRAVDVAKKLYRSCGDPSTLQTLSNLEKAIERKTPEGIRRHMSRARKAATKAGKS